MHYFSNFFWYRTLHVSDRFTVHHQQSSTVHTAIGIYIFLFTDINSMPHYRVILHALHNLSLRFTITFTFNNHKTVVEIHHKVDNNILTSSLIINRLTPNDQYMGRTASLTSKRCILYIYSTNIGTKYFKHALYSPFFLFKMQFVSKC